MRRAIVLAVIVAIAGAAAWGIWLMVADDGFDADPDRLASVEGHLQTIREELDAMPTFSRAARIPADFVSCRIESESLDQPKVWRNWSFTDATAADGEQKLLAELQRQGWEQTGSGGKLKTVRSDWSANALIYAFNLDGKGKNDHVGVEVRIDGREPCRVSDDTDS